MIRLTSLAGASPAFDFSCGVQECQPDYKTNRVVQENLAGGVRVYQPSNPKKGFKVRTLSLTPTQLDTLRAMVSAGQFYSFSHDLDDGPETLASCYITLNGSSVWSRRGKYIVQFEVWEV